jgi:hypothetical protein
MTTAPKYRVVATSNTSSNVSSNSSSSSTADIHHAISLNVNYNRSGNHGFLHQRCRLGWWIWAFEEA